MLWLGLYFPHLALELFHGSAPAREAPLVIVDGPAPRPFVYTRNRAAARLGIHPGMPLGAAHSLSGALRVHVRDPRQEQAALEGLAAWAQQFTSLVSLEPPQGLLLEIGASLRLFGGLDPLVQRIERGLLALGHHARLAVAPTPHGAWLLSLAGGGRIVTEQRALRACLEPLPIESIAQDAELGEALRGMGLRTLGELLRLSRAGLARRVGPRLLSDLDRALGSIPDPRAPYTPPTRFDRSLPLPAEVTGIEALRFPLRRLLLELAGFLAGRGAGIQRLGLRLTHARGAITRLPLELLRPTRDAEHLEQLLRERLERHRLHAPVEALGLEAEGLVPLAHRDRDLFVDADPARMDWPRLAEQLRARLGPEAVRALCPVADHRPERAFAYAEAGAACTTHGPAASRPLWLLEGPLPLELRGGAPWLEGRLALRQGPERIETGWWDGEDIARDYFVAENPAGERFWIYREKRHPGQWYLHGVFG